MPQTYSTSDFRGEVSQIPTLNYYNVHFVSRILESRAIKKLSLNLITLPDLTSSLQETQAKWHLRAGIFNTVLGQMIQLLPQSNSLQKEKEKDLKATSLTLQGQNLDLDY